MSRVEATRQDDEANAVYALGSSLGESERLRRQAEELAPDSAALLDQVGLRPGQRAVDLGCGPRGVLDLLAARVSPGGKVVGVDADPVHVTMATEFVTSNELSGVEVITADARSTGLPADSMDVVHCRTLLINVPEPTQVVAEMVRLAKPGGWVVAIEPDTDYAMCYPPNPAFERIRDLFPVVYGRHGADPALGRRVPELFRQAGLEAVGVEARVPGVPTRSFASHHPTRSRAGHAPTGRGDGTRDPGGARRPRRGSPRSPRAT
jgi:SAM-dependent methyltransferase